MAYSPDHQNIHISLHKLHKANYLDFSRRKVNENYWIAIKQQKYIDINKQKS